MSYVWHGDARSVLRLGTPGTKDSTEELRLVVGRLVMV